MFELITQFFSALLPVRRVVAPDRWLVTFKNGRHVSHTDKALWYWPFWTAVKELPFCPDPDEIEAMTVTTKDGKPVSFALAIETQVSDPIKAAISVDDIDRLIHNKVAETAAFYVGCCEDVSEVAFSTVEEQIQNTAAEMLDYYGIELLSIGFTDVYPVRCFKLLGTEMAS